MIERKITKINGKPYKRKDYWCLDVEYDNYGLKLNTCLTSHNESDIRGVEVGQLIDL